MLEHRLQSIIHIATIYFLHSTYSDYSIQSVIRCPPRVFELAAAEGRLGLHRARESSYNISIIRFYYPQFVWHIKVWINILILFLFSLDVFFFLRLLFCLYVRNIIVLRYFRLVNTLRIILFSLLLFWFPSALDSLQTRQMLLNGLWLY